MRQVNASDKVSWRLFERTKAILKPVYQPASRALHGLPSDISVEPQYYPMAGTSRLTTVSTITVRISSGGTMYEPQSTPLSIAGVLDQGFKLLRASFKHVFVLALVSAFVTSLPSIVVGKSAEDPDLAASLLIVTGLITIVGVFVSLLCFGAIVLRIHAIMQNKMLSVSESLKMTLRRFIAIFLTGLLYGLAVAGGLVLLIVPGIILSVSLAFGLYMVITEDLGPLEALKASRHLVRGNWWRTASALTVVFIITLIGYAAIVFLGGIIAATVGADGSIWAIELIVVPLITALMSILFYVFAMAIMRDLQLRKSGEDLLERMDKVGAQ